MSIDRPTRRRVLLAALALPTLLAAACGSSSSSSSSSASSSSSSASSSSSSSAPAATFPVTVKGGNGSVTIGKEPSAIVSLSPTATEMLYAVGAGNQVTAVDDQSTYPADAPRTKLSGFQPNTEAVAAYKPDLVVISNDSNGLLAGLTKLGIPVLSLPAPATLADAYAQIETLGTATGHADVATKVAGDTKAAVDAAVASVPSAKGKKVYHELDNTFYSATSATFIGSVYQAFGLKDIADGAKGAAASGGYPQLSAEYIVASAPDLIVLADGGPGGESPGTVAKRPGWSAIPAVKNGDTMVVDNDLASRWGPRVAQFAQQVAKELGGQ